MSSYDLTARDASHTVRVGWDNPMSTFFAQVFSLESGSTDEDPTEILWLGSTLREVLTVEDLADRLAAHAEIPQAIMENLRADRVRDLDRGPTPLQRRGRTLF